MAYYVCLVTFTDTGVKNLRKTTARAKAFTEKMEANGIKIVTTLWTVGTYDIVHVFQAPDEEVAASFAFTLSSLGNVRTETMRAFDADEMESIIRRVQTPYDLLTNKVEE
jgi:uncharacterized protein with GYD domain